jgi:hypothetical protein
VAKRSPILGYNHNVRYRGLVFHVQTEDSGLLNPHLFTHLFHGGVIVSTRKLVYDSGANEEAIKSLMQAQHKAVLKDLKKGAFDDKIDQYLGDTPGLEPRGASAARQSEPVLDSEPTVATPATVATAATIPVEAAPTIPVEVPPTVTAADTSVDLPVSPPAEIDLPTVPRVPTAERISPSSVRFKPSSDDHAAIVQQEISAQTSITIRTPPPSRTITPTQRVEAPFIPGVVEEPPNSETPDLDSSPEILVLEEDEPSARMRIPRDTVEAPLSVGSSDGVPLATNPNESAAVRPRPDTQSGRPRSGDRPALGAAALPPVRPITRPPSRPVVTTPPPVIARPLTDAEGNPRHNTDAIEVYAPAPPSVEPPPGERTERPGQYSMNRKAHDMREHKGRIAVPAGLGRPGRRDTSQPPIVRKDKDGSSPHPAIPQPPGPSVPRSDTQPRVTKPHGTVTAVEAPTRATPPLTSRASQANAQVPVVMTRPAVIVGAPPKPVGTSPRVRKAREEEGGRGFGQGLISEKSLDEVILAYLSEDGDDK